MAKLNSWKMACAVFLLDAATAIAAPAQTFGTLAEFNGSDGNSPGYVGLVQGHDGNLYGTTPSGALYRYCASGGCGTVFKVTLLGELDAIYDFCGCDDGTHPDAGLVQGTDGRLYGTTGSGGVGSGGTVFSMSYTGPLTTLHNFNGADGANPNDLLIEAGDGNFYGTTTGGGIHNEGTVFKVTPSGALTTLHSFDSKDGSSPIAGLIQATDGDFYGTTYQGGAHGNGTVFRITQTGKTATLHNFDVVDGAYPFAGLTQASDGDLYGATGGGGQNACSCGTIFKITTEGVLTTLYSFNMTDGASPYASLAQATDGNFYGTTGYGGDLTCNPPEGCGTVFRMTSQGTLTTLHSFEQTDGWVPFGRLLQDTNGTFYGTASRGGNAVCAPSDGCGTIFSVSTGLGPFVAFVRTAGKVGQTGGILGQGFTGTTSVAINGIAATFTVISDTFLKATVPAGATTGYVTVTTPSGMLTSNVPFHVIP